MKRIAVGDVAPDFVLKDNRAQEIRLSDYRGKKVLLSWHPLARCPPLKHDLWPFCNRRHFIP